MGNGQINFRADMVDALELDGKYVKFFLDIEKKTIGWTVIKGDADLDNLAEARLFKRSADGAVKIGVSRMLNKVGYMEHLPVKNLEVHLYKTPLMEGDVNYVILPDIQHEIQGDKRKVLEGV